MEGRARRRSAWAASGYAVGHLLLVWPLALVLLGWATAAALCLVVVGVVVVRAMVPALVGIANTHVLMYASVLGRPVPTDQLVPDRSLGPVAQVRAWVPGTALWRHLAWLAYASTAGTVLSVLPLLLPLGAVPLVVVPLVLTSRDATEGHVLFLVLGTAAALAMVLAWWRLSWPLMQLNARVAAGILAPDRSEELSRRIHELARSRAASVDDAAGELRRIERDLHDGAQVRLVALAMQLGMAQEALSGVAEAETARGLLQEARASGAQALADVRDVVRGILPPLLADRGLVAAVTALVGDLPMPVDLDVDLAGRPPEAVESALYFSTAECLANVARHAGASRVGVRLIHDGVKLRAQVRDDGRGGARIGAGSGLSGIGRRLDAFDGTLEVASEVGGPTVVTMEVPCALSSARTTPS